MREEHHVEEAELRRYLLGELTLEARVLVEERMFLDGEYMQLAQAVEDELVDDYANRDLTPAELERFETHFLTRPEHREDLRIAQALKRYLTAEAESAAAAHAPESPASEADSGRPARPARESGPSFFSALFGRKAVLGLSFAAALIILSVIAWLVAGSWRSQGGRPPMQAQDPAPQPTAPGQQQRQETANAPADSGPSPGAGAEVAGGREGSQPPPPPGGRQGDGPAGRQGGRPQTTPPRLGQAPARVVAFVLMPGGGVRGGGKGESVSVAADVGAVVLRLPLVEEGEFSTYRATLESGGRVARAFDKLTPEVDPELGRFVSVKVPAELLRPRSYRVKLSGVAADGRARSLTSYAFTVERR